MRKIFRCAVVLIYAYVPGSGPGTMLDWSTTRLPGLASATSADWIPASGRSGRPVSGSTGIAIVLPGLVRDVSSNDTYRNLPSGDQAHGHDLPRAQIGRGDPPAVGTAIVTEVAPAIETDDGPAAESSAIAINHRRSGEIF